jgi:hypothetical protein
MPPSPFARLNRPFMAAFLIAAGFAAAARIHAADTPAAWQAGVATAEITPQSAMWMGGYAARTHPSEGTAQPLRAKALALVDATGGRFVFITLDAIGVTRPLRKNLDARLATAYQLKPHEFVLTASHTHSGPEFRPGRVPEEAVGGEAAAGAYMSALEGTLQELVGRALKSLAPAKLAYGHARAGFAMNRRLPRPGGEPVNSPNPDGPVDHDVPVLRIDGADGQLRAVLFGYACHNTTLTQTSYQFCADYAGYAQQYLEADHPGMTALFLTGCGGDQNPYPRGILPLAEAHGRTLATAVDAALGAKTVPLAGNVRSAYAEIELDYAPPPTRAEYEARLTSKDKVEASHARRMLARMDKEGGLPKRYPYPVQIVRLGPALEIVTLSGEVVVDYSLRLKRELTGDARLWMAAYSNDVMGYIPSERVLREGGYEGGGAMRLGVHPGPWAAGLEEKIIAKVKELDRATRE